jgi:hypothetical protein
MPKNAISYRSAKKMFYGPIWSDLKSPSKNENVVLTTKPESLKTAMKTNANPHSHSVAISNLKSQIVVVSCLIRAPIPPVFRNTGVPARFAPNFLLVSFEQFVVVLIFGLTFYGSRFTPHTAFPPKLQIPVIRSHQESSGVIRSHAKSSLNLQIPRPGIFAGLHTNPAMAKLLPDPIISLCCPAICFRFGVRLW